MFIIFQTKTLSLHCHIPFTIKSNFFHFSLKQKIMWTLILVFEMITHQKLIPVFEVYKSVMGAVDKFHNIE